MTVSTAKSRQVAHERMIRESLPFQVALPDDFCVGENFEVLEKFCIARFGRRADTTHVNAIWEDGGDERFRLYCFSNAVDAEVFARHFEGTLFDPKRDREAGRVHGAWRRPGGWSSPLRCGPLRLPSIWQRGGGPR